MYSKLYSRSGSAQTKIYICIILKNPNPSQTPLSVAYLSLASHIAGLQNLQDLRIFSPIINPWCSKTKCSLTSSKMPWNLPEKGRREERLGRNSIQNNVTETVHVEPWVLSFCFKGPVHIRFHVTELRLMFLNSYLAFKTHWFKSRLI